MAFANRLCFCSSEILDVKILDLKYLHERSEETEQSPQKSFGEGNVFAVLSGDFRAVNLRIQKVVFDLGNGGCFIHENAAFKMMIKTAEIHVYGADNALNVVADHCFGMDKAGGVFKNPDAEFDESAVIGLAD